MSQIQGSNNGTKKLNDYYDRYSRQHYVLGEVAMNKMQQKRVLISGLGGVGVEIAKNVALAGVNRLTLHDTKVATWDDLSVQYYLSCERLGENRASVTFPYISGLNPYVQYSLNTSWSFEGDLSFLDEFNCIVLTEQPLATQIRVNDYCHERGIAFITADAFGVFAMAFSDCGPSHEIFDPNGEAVKQVHLEGVQLGKETILITLENHLHGFEEGDYVKFIEIQGTTQLNYVNNEVYKVSKVISPYKFAIDVDSSSFSPYLDGGIAIETKVTTVNSYKPLREALLAPEFANFDLQLNHHIFFQSLHKYINIHKRFPRVWDLDDSAEFSKLALSEFRKIFPESDGFNEALCKKFSWCTRGRLIGICSFLGGYVAQEVIKAVSNKFTPLKQFIYFDACELLADPTSKDFDLSLYLPTETRYSAQIQLLGKELHEKIANTKTFLIGAGAIGCETLKNLAMLGLSSGTLGKITVTDNDLIEKSNLSRQFLFRETDLQRPKSVVAAKASKILNLELQIEAFLDRVAPETESTYSDNFFRTLDLVIGALDNVNSRIYLDQRCVTNYVALLESGTLGTKGHVQVIVPHLTESYSSQADPKEDSYPLCTVKSFPYSIEHTIQWARSKFESIFVEKPTQIYNFVNDQSGFIERLNEPSAKNISYSTLKFLAKFLQNRFHTFSDCIKFARLKFQSFYYNSILNLLNKFPLETKLKDGSLFWKSPKRPPEPLEFSLENSYARNFLISTALILSNIYCIDVPENFSDVKYLKGILDSVEIAPFKASNKIIEIDPDAKNENKIDSDKIEEIVGILKDLCKKDWKNEFKVNLNQFEKDVDSNHHVEFITACSNLRAINYKIDPVDNLETKRIAGKIIPAIATTTSVVAGLASIELIKIIKKAPLEHYKNCFLNLALPYLQLSEPGAAPRTYLNKELYYTLWDKWEVNQGDILLEEFVKFFHDKYKINVTAVIHGVNTIYMNIMPIHKARLKKKLSSLIKNISADDRYVDLVVTFEDENKEVVNGPDIRFYWK